MSISTIFPLLLMSSSLFSMDFGDAGMHPYFEVPTRNIIDFKNKRVDQDKVIKKKYLLLYFSAHWCAPCKAFTPELVNFYNQNGGGDKFEILFVSSDQSEEKMINYMSTSNMPWVGLNFRSNKMEEIKKKYGGPGIPCLTLVDGKDNIVFHSYVQGQYVGPHKVLDQFSDLLKKK